MTLNDAIFEALKQGPVKAAGLKSKRALDRQEAEELEALDALSKIGEPTALESLNDFTRMKMREDDFFRRILPPMAI